MINTGTPQPTSPALRILGWVGLWLGAALLFPVLTVWTHSFRPQRPLRLLHFGSPLFWQAVGIDVLFASMMTFSQWQDNKKPKKRKAAPPTTPKDRWKPLWAGGILLGFIVLQMLASNPGATIQWGGVLGGAAALVLVFILIMRCAKLTQPPRVYEDAAADTLPLPSSESPLPLGVRPPKNNYRAEVNTHEVIYHRPLSHQVGMAIGGLFIMGLCGVALWFALYSLEPIFVPGMQTRSNPAFALMMGAGFVFMLIRLLCVVALTGPRELRVSPSDGTYIYRLAAPVPWPAVTKLMADDLGRINRDETGLPWHVIEYWGKREDIAGVQRLETTNKSATSYSLLLCWHDPSRPPMRVGYSPDETKARALQTQAAEDLGVPLLPDEVV